MYKNPFALIIEVTGGAVIIRNSSRRLQFNFDSHNYAKKNFWSRAIWVLTGLRVYGYGPVKKTEILKLYSDNPYCSQAYLIRVNW